MNSSYAPVILFVYNRPLHTLQTIKHLNENIGIENAVLYIYADGPKKDCSYENREKIESVRNILNFDFKFKSVKIIRSESNKGLANSVISGVSEIINKNGKAIILEDDLLTSPHFYQFCNDALNKFEPYENVMGISGYGFPISNSKSTKAYFLKAVSSWGWATWAHSWNKLIRNPLDIASKVQTKEDIRLFDLNNSYPYFNMLKETISKRIDSWAILWYGTIFLNHGLVLYPNHSLVFNIGLDGSGTNWKNINNYLKQETINSDFPKIILPQNAEFNLDKQRKLERYLKRKYQHSIFNKLLNFLDKIS